MNAVVRLLRERQQDLYVSASALRVLEACPREHYYKYIAAVPPEDTASRLVLGGAVHRALAAFYEHQRDGRPEPSVDQLVAVARSSVLQAAAGLPPVLIDEDEDAGSLVVEAARLLEVFVVEGFRPDRVLAVEEAFCLPLTHPGTGEVLGYDERLVGAFDLVVEDAGRVVVIDHKVVSRVDKARAEAPDLQLGVYAWASRRIFNADQVNLRYQNLVRSKVARVELQEVGRQDGDEAEAIESVVAGLELVHAAVGSGAPKRFLARRRSWRCRDCSWRQRCSGDRQ